jgi:hypothetical protein
LNSEYKYQKNNITEDIMMCLAGLYNEALYDPDKQSLIGKEVMITSKKCGMAPATLHGAELIVNLPPGAGRRTVSLSSPRATAEEVTKKLGEQLKIKGRLYIKVGNEAPRVLKANDEIAKDASYYFFPLP